MKLLKNRTVLGLLCIAAALLICFVLTPLLNAGMSKKTTIVPVSYTHLTLPTTSRV